MITKKSLSFTVAAVSLVLAMTAISFAPPTKSLTQKTRQFHMYCIAVVNVPIPGEPGGTMVMQCGLPVVIPSFYCSRHQPPIPQD